MIPAVGDMVYDRWWPWRIGRVVKVLRTRVKIRFQDTPTRISTYDNAHCQFLEPCAR